MNWTYLNDSFFQKEEVRISPFDRGFLFGDAVYEVIPVYEGKVFLFSEHMARLERSLQETGISKPLAWDRMDKIIDQLLKKNNYPYQTVYLQITRGVDSGRHHTPSLNIKPTLFITSYEFTVNPYRFNPKKEGLDVKIVEDPRWHRCDIKAVTLLSNIMALEQANSDEKEDVIFHRNGKITEGTSSNVFAVFGELIMTPPTSKHILSGVTRKYIIDLLKSRNYSVSEEEIDVQRLYGADEVWLTSSTKEIQPIKSIDDKELISPESENSLWFKVLSSFFSQD